LVGRFWQFIVARVFLGAGEAPMFSGAAINRISQHDANMKLMRLACPERSPHPFELSSQSRHRLTLGRNVAR
jgi:hypothetical protein